MGSVQAGCLGVQTVFGECAAGAGYVFGGAGWCLGSVWPALGMQTVFGECAAGAGYAFGGCRLVFLSVPQRQLQWTLRAITRLIITEQRWAEPPGRRYQNRPTIPDSYFPQPCSKY